MTKKIYRQSSVKTKIYPSFHLFQAGAFCCSCLQFYFHLSTLSSCKSSKFNKTRGQSRRTAEEKIQRKGFVSVLHYLFLDWLWKEMQLEIQSFCDLSFFGGTFQRFCQFILKKTSFSRAYWRHLNLLFLFKKSF